jgi:hypothetical protein
MRRHVQHWMKKTAAYLPLIIAIVSPFLKYPSPVILKKLQCYIRIKACLSVLEEK